MGLTLSTAPAVEPISTAELKKQLEIAPSDTAHDSHLALLIAAARRIVERETRRALITQAWIVTDVDWPRRCSLWLPRPPLRSVTKIEYVDPAGDVQTWPSGEYVVITGSSPGRVDLLPGGWWPTIQAGRADAVRVSYTAGYGDAAADVPDEYRQAVRALAAYWFEVRTSADPPEHLLRYLRGMRPGAGREHFGLAG